MNSTERAQLRSALEHDDADLEQTTADMDLYVDYDTGSDVKNVGLGTALAPYKTPKHAANQVARRIAHNVRLHLACRATPGEKYPASSMPRREDCIFVGDGCLSIFGVGAPSRKKTTGGPHTVASNVKTDVAQVLAVSAVAWTPDEFVGYFVRVVTGGHVGRTYPVYGNDSAHITIPLDPTGDGVENADTIELITPCTIVEMEDLDLFYDEHTVASSVAGGFSHLTLANLWLDASGSSSAWGQLKIHGGGSQAGPVLEFVRIDVLDMGAIIADTHINYFPPIDISYIADCDADVTNMGELSCGASIVNTTVRAGVGLYLYGNCVAFGVAVAGQVEAYFAGHVQFQGGAASFKGTDCCSGGTVYAWLAGVDEDTPACLLNGGIWSDVLVHVDGDCNYAVDTDYGAIVRLHGESICSITKCDHGFLAIGGMCKITTDHALAGAIGAGPIAYRFKVTSEDVAAWPAAAGYDTDAKGAELLRVS